MNINFEYLKNVIIKYMSSRTAEAKQLLRVIATLLHFSRDEENRIKAFLASQSWF